MSREAAVAQATQYFDEGGFESDLARRVAIRTESQNPDAGEMLNLYLTGEMVPTFERLGFRCQIIPNPSMVAAHFWLQNGLKVRVFRPYWVTAMGMSSVGKSMPGVRVCPLGR